MHNDEILILKGTDVADLLEDREMEIIETVSLAYQVHSDGHSSLPHSVFLRIPDNARDRIIALPAFLGDQFNVAGIKWIASFPENLNRGQDRASAVVILNSPLTGRPEAIIEGSLISAKRTAASAALAAKTLMKIQPISIAGIVGCGVINFEITRFLRAALPNLEALAVYDLDRRRAERFKVKCLSTFPSLTVEIVRDIKSALDISNLVSFSTTAIKPHVFEIPSGGKELTILNISLRDFSPEVILMSENVVDDVDHVCRAETSIHLAEQMVGNRDFIKCTLADLLKGRIEAGETDGKPTIFSPFGLGVLDLAVSKLVRDLGLHRQRGTIINSFLPDSWAADAEA